MDETTFQQLLRSHARLMAGAIRRVCGRRHQTLVPDVEQEVYLALWKRLGGRGKEIEHPISYLYKTALTTAAAMVRKVAPAETETEIEPGDLPGPEDLAPGRLLPGERARLLAQLLAGLPEEQARALKAYLAGFNHEEVASLFGWTESVARHRIYRAIEALKKRMNEETGEAGLGRRADRGH